MLEALLPELGRSWAAALQPFARALKSFGARHGLVYLEADDTLWLVRVARGGAVLYRLALSPRDAGTSCPPAP